MIARHNILTVRICPLIAPVPILTRGTEVDAWIFLVGTLSSSTTNVVFIYVLVRFPVFLRHVKAEGAAPDVVVRLATFYEFNVCPPPSIPIH